MFVVQNNIEIVIIVINTCANTSKLFSHRTLMLFIATLMEPLKTSDGGLFTDVLLFID
jgi:hypothetical protein